MPYSHIRCTPLQGLLQSEVEGVDNDKVGFYGRCMLHATRHRCVSDSRPVDTKMDSPEQKDFTCARTEVSFLIGVSLQVNNSSQRFYSLIFLTFPNRVTRVAKGKVSGTIFTGSPVTMADVLFPRNR